MTHAPLLFLDFNGVLHPAGSAASAHFMHLPRFQHVMIEYPEVEIVVSSGVETYAYTLHKLRALFAPSVRSRVIGATAGIYAECEEEMRYRQILRFLRRWERLGPWLALDDSEDEFPANCSQLVLCDSSKGFDEQAAATLKAKLRALGTRSIAA
jgi:hypothetical protein